MEGAVHGDATVSDVDGSTREFDWDRGRITALDASTISLTRRDGQAVTVAYDEDTIVLGGLAVGDLETGDAVWIISEDTGAETLLARVVRPLCHI